MENDRIFALLAMAGCKRGRQVVDTSALKRETFLIRNDFYSQPMGGTKRNRNDTRPRMNPSEQRRFFKGIVSNRVPSPLFFPFFFALHFTRPFQRCETSRQNSPHPSAPNRRLIHAATMKEEKCFVLAINNNKIRRSMRPANDITPFFFLPSCLRFFSRFLLPIQLDHSPPPVLPYRETGNVRTGAITAPEFRGEKNYTFENDFPGRRYVKFI